MTTISRDEFKGLLRARVTQTRSLRAAARSLGVSASYLSRMLTTDSDVGPTLCRALGYRRIVAYQRSLRNNEGGR